jgi:hypothetical protein
VSATTPVRECRCFSFRHPSASRSERKQSKTKVKAAGLLWQSDLTPSRFPLSLGRVIIRNRPRGRDTRNHRRALVSDPLARPDRPSRRDAPVLRRSKLVGRSSSRPKLLLAPNDAVVHPRPAKADLSSLERIFYFLPPSCTPPDSNPPAWRRLRSPRPSCSRARPSRACRKTHRLPCNRWTIVGLPRGLNRRTTDMAQSSTSSSPRPSTGRRINTSDASSSPRVNTSPAYYGV